MRILLPVYYLGLFTSSTVVFNKNVIDIFMLLIGIIYPV